MSDRINSIGTGSIISRFDHVQTAINPDDIVCKGFMEIKPHNGCIYNCQWCYLKGTFFRQHKNTWPWLYVKKTDMIIKDIMKFLASGSGPELLNMGEVADAMALQWADLTLFKEIILMFMKQPVRNQPPHKLLLLTKSGPQAAKTLIDAVNSWAHCNYTAQEVLVPAYSLNCQEVAQQYEKAPSIQDRLQAISLLLGHGYKVRLRFDPHVPIKEWDLKYRDLYRSAYQIFEAHNAKPERITLGSLRALQSTVKGCEALGNDISWVKYCTENSQWGMRVPRLMRIPLYKWYLDWAKLTNWHDVPTALCKEEVTVWEELGLDWKDIKCNCLY